MTEKQEAIQLLTPEGRLINHSLWERDVYVSPKGKKGEPLYKVELALEWDDTGDLYDAVIETARREWGDDAITMDDDGNEVLADGIRDPIIDGDGEATKREKKGKKGDAYAGKAVIRANTKFNVNGEDGPGGVYVADANGEPLDFAQRGIVFRGSYGIAAVTVQAYETEGRGVKFYLRGYQHTREGERLRSNDVGAAFKPQAQATTGKGRKARAK